VLCTSFHAFTAGRSHKVFDDYKDNPPARTQTLASRQIANLAAHARPMLVFNPRHLQAYSFPFRYKRELKQNDESLNIVVKAQTERRVFEHSS
jgi:hypothetical protein